MYRLSPEFVYFIISKRTWRAYKNICYRLKIENKIKPSQTKGGP